MEYRGFFCFIILLLLSKTFKVFNEKKKKNKKKIMPRTANKCNAFENKFSYSLYYTYMYYSRCRCIVFMNWKTNNKRNSRACDDLYLNIYNNIVRITRYKQVRSSARTKFLIKRRFDYGLSRVFYRNQRTRFVAKPIQSVRTRKTN